MRVDRGNGWYTRWSSDGSREIAVQTFHSRPPSPIVPSVFPPSPRFDLDSRIRALEIQFGVKAVGEHHYRNFRGNRLAASLVRWCRSYGKSSTEKDSLCRTFPMYLRYHLANTMKNNSVTKIDYVFSLSLFLSLSPFLPFSPFYISESVL